MAIVRKFERQFDDLKGTLAGRQILVSHASRFVPEISPEMSAILIEVCGVILVVVLRVNQFKNVSEIFSVER